MISFDLLPDVETENEYFKFIPAGEKEFDIDIMIPTYQHEKYIAQAIESVLMQETKYRYRMVICEDCSTDRTREIVLGYAEKHPEKIALLLWKKNSYSVGMINSQVGRRLCNSKYYLSLEGDDFWISRRKIEVQVDFLEKHPEYIACAHNVIKVDENGEILHGDYSQYPILEEHVLSSEDAISFKHEFQTATFVRRNIITDWSKEKRDRLFEVDANGDRRNFTLYALKGDIFFFREAMSAYRRTYTGSSYNARMADKNISYKIYSDCYNISKYVKEEMDIDIPTEHICFMCWNGALQMLMQKPQCQNIRVFMQLTNAIIKRHGKYFCKRIISGMAGK